MPGDGGLQNSRRGVGATIEGFDPQPDVTVGKRCAVGDEVTFSLMLNAKGEPQAGDKNCES